MSVSEQVGEQRPAPRRNGMLLIGGIVAVAVLAIGTLVAVTASPGADEADQLAATPASTPTVAPTRWKIAMPATLLGRKLIGTTNSLDRTSWGGDMRAALQRHLPDGGGWFGEAYTNDGGTILAGAARHASTDTALTLATAFESMQPGQPHRSPGILVSALRTVEAGPLGGVAMCGEGDFGGVRCPVCGWADGETVGLIQFAYTAPAAAIEEQFRAARAEIQTAAA